MSLAVVTPHVVMAKFIRFAGRAVYQVGFFIIGSESGVNVAPRHESIANPSAWPHCLIEESANGILDVRVCVYVCVCVCARLRITEVWMQCHTLSGCSYAKTLTVTVLAGYMSMCEKVLLFGGFGPWLMKKIHKQVHLRTCFFIFRWPSGNECACLSSRVCACIRACVARGGSESDVSL